MSKRKVSLKEQIEALGFFENEKNYPDAIYLSNGVVRLRCYGNKIDIAVEHCFDRWANSVDFTFSVPKTQKALEAKFAEVSRLVSLGRYDSKCPQEMRL
jgi:hypothetical protein